MVADSRFFGAWGLGAGSHANRILALASEGLELQKSKVGLIMAPPECHYHLKDAPGVAPASLSEISLSALDHGGRRRSFVSMSQERLTLSTDAYNQQPIFFSSADGTLLFSSELGWLRQVIDAPVSALGVLHYLAFNYPLAPTTYYNGIKVLAPNSRYTFSDTSSDPEQVTFDGAIQHADSLKELLTQSLKRMGCGAEAWFHLSGGLDTASLVHCQRARGLRPNTLTAWIDEADSDLRYARLVAQETGARSVELQLNADGLTADIDDIIAEGESPVMAPGIITFWQVARWASEHGVRRLVSGIGGDHPFIGDRLLVQSGLQSESEVRESQVFKQCPATLQAILGDYWPSAMKILKAEFSQRLTEAGSLVKYHENTFLTEHLRMSTLSHRKWGVQLLNPMLDPAFMALCLGDTREDMSNKLALRKMLSQVNSAAASRQDKSQMSFDHSRLAELLRTHVLDVIADPQLRLPGFNYQPLQTLLDSSRGESKYVLRIVWSIYNLHRWFQICGLTPPDLRELVQGKTF